MLKRIHIRNYALIDQLEIDFSERLTIITGETGAGKSILLGALGLVMGERADAKVFYNATEKCVVEAIFEVSKYELRPFFEENELDYDDEVVIRRELNVSGKSRAFVNDTPVNNQVLQRLTDVLIDMHQQFDTLDIHHVNFQLRMIDALADNKAALANYQQRYKSYTDTSKKLKQLRELSENASKELDFQQYLLKEFDAVRLESGEQERLESEQTKMANTEDIKRVFGMAYHQLQESETSVIGQLREISRSFQASRRLAPDLEELNRRLDTVLIELQDLARECENTADNAEFDPQRLTEITDRLTQIYKLQKKHGVHSIDELLAISADLAQKVGRFSNIDGDIQQLELEIQQLRAALKIDADQLSLRRQKVIPDFEQKVRDMLAQLSMPHARLMVEMRPSPDFTATGTDIVQFLFSTNPGSKPLPIKDVASGGELSRLTLCTKSLVADAIPLPTLIFDEIDSGISGDVSMRMGQILKELSTRHQVISITHTPQIAAKADKHYFVYKKVDGNKTATRIKLLETTDRIHSIAIMLSGEPPSTSALATARELIEG